jgi:hypothetical protein
VRGRGGRRGDHGSTRFRPTASVRAQGTVPCGRRCSGSPVRRRHCRLVALLHFRRPAGRCAELASRAAGQRRPPRPAPRRRRRRRSGTPPPALVGGLLAAAPTHVSAPPLPRFPLVRRAPQRPGPEPGQRRRCETRTTCSVLPGLIGIVSPGLHETTVVSSDGGSAGVPSSRSNLKVKVHPALLCGTGRLDEHIPSVSKLPPAPPASAIRPRAADGGVAPPA